jgi:hypothetical protein
MTLSDFFNLFSFASKKKGVQPVILVNDSGNTYEAGGGGGGSVNITTLAKEGKQDAQTTELIAIKNKIIADPATQGKQDAANTILNSILAELRDDVFVQATIWEDRSNTTSVFYREERIRSQDDGTINTIFTRLSDNVVVGSLPAGCIPAQGATDRLIQYYRYIAVNAGTGYAVGNFVVNTLVFDTGGTGAVIGNIWYNLTTSTAIATPPLSADLIDPEDWLRSAFGSQTDSPAPNDTGTASYVSLFKRSLQGITTLISGLGTVVTNFSTLLGRIPALSIAGQFIANSLGVALPRKQSITGLAATVASTTYANLLDSAAGSTPTDVRDFQNGVLIVASTATTGSYIVQGAFDAGFTIGVKTIQLSEIDVQNINPINGAITPTATTRAFFANLAGINYLRINLATGVTSGNVVTYAVLNQANFTPNQINVQQATGGNLNVVITSGTITTVTTVTTLSQFAASAAASDATANPTTTIARTANQLFNGTTWDRFYNNQEVTLLANLARTTTQAGTDIINYNWKKLIVCCTILNAGSGSITISIDGKDSSNAAYYNILTSAALTANGTYRLRIGEMLASVANQVAQDYLPRIIRITATANNTNSVTYSVGYNFGL